MAKKGLGSVLQLALPAIGTALLPGVGTAIGSSLGAGSAFAPAIGAAALGGAGGLLGGGGVKGALSGALGGAALGGGGNLLGGALGGSGALGTALGSGLLGAASGGISNGLSGALTGAALGAGGGYLSGGGASQLGLTGPGSILGEAYNPAQGPTLSGAPLGNAGSGVLGSVTQAASGLGNMMSGGGASSFGGAGVTGGGSSYLPLAGSLLGGANSLSATEQAKKALMQAQGQATDALAPYNASGLASNTRLAELMGTGGDPNAADYGYLTKSFSPGDLTQTPGYQFQLEEGNKALNRANSASGNLASGAALKRAQQFGQGLASQTYADAYARDAATKNQIYNQYAGQAGSGLNAANSLGNIYGTTGTAKANADIAGSNILNQALSSALSGSGAYGSRYKMVNGQLVLA